MRLSSNLTLGDRLLGLESNPLLCYDQLSVFHLRNTEALTRTIVEKHRLARKGGARQGSGEIGNRSATCAIARLGLAHSPSIDLLCYFAPRAPPACCYTCYHLAFDMTATICPVEPNSWRLPSWYSHNVTSIRKDLATRAGDLFVRQAPFGVDIAVINESS